MYFVFWLQNIHTYMYIIMSNAYCTSIQLCLHTNYFKYPNYLKYIHIHRYCVLGYHVVYHNVMRSNMWTQMRTGRREIKQVRERGM